MTKKLTELPVAVAVADDDPLLIEQGGLSKQAAKSLIGAADLLYRFDPAVALATQIETTAFAAAPGTDGVLSIDKFTLDPYADAIRSTHTAGTSGGWKLYRLLKDGAPLILPNRYTMRCRMGARDVPDGASGDGLDAIPAIVPYMLDGDADHFFMMARSSGTPIDVQTFAMNGESTFGGTATVGFLNGTVFTVGPNNVHGQNMKVDVIARALSLSDDPAMELQIATWHDTPTNFAINIVGSTWTPVGGASNDPDTAWDAGWLTATPEIGAALMFYEFAGSAGFSQIGELEITKYVLDK